MGITLRAYIFDPTGVLKRVPLRIRDGLALGDDAIPEYAGTRQAVAHVVLESEGGKPMRILDATGSYWSFDGEGSISEDLSRTAMGAMQTADAVERAARAKVVDLRPQIRRKEWEKENRWDLSQADLDRIAADIWPNLAPEVAAASDVQTVKGKAPKKPPVPYAAGEALRAILQTFLDVAGKIEDLSETALKGFAFEARRHAKEGYAETPLWEAAAAMAEREREIKARRRTGKGAWYAVCRLMLWNEGHTEEREIDTVEERCESKKEAIAAAGRLLAAHAHKFSDCVSVEAEVLSDLEWNSRDPAITK